MNLEKKMTAYRKYFNMSKNEVGDKLLRWTEKNLHTFTAPKLEYMLHLAKTRNNYFREEFVKKVRAELIRRKVGWSPIIS